MTLIQSTEQPDSSRHERTWPLDASIATLAGLILYLIVMQLRFDDPRWLFNAWTYVVAVPLVALLLAVVSHGLVSHHVHKSIQLGFLFSVFVHLLLLMLAVNVIIFSRYFPQAFTGTVAERVPVQKTVSENLFLRPPREVNTPDWSRPVDAATASRVKPEEIRKAPPLTESSPRLEMLRQPEPQPPEPRKFLAQRQKRSESMPQPLRSPARRAQRESTSHEFVPSLQSPTAPRVPVEPEIRQQSESRQLARPQRQPATSSAAPAPTPAPAPADVAMPTPSSRVSLEKNRRPGESIPEISAQPRRPGERTNDPRVQPAGSSPATPNVAVAIDDPTADLELSPTPVPVIRRSAASDRSTIALPSASSAALPDASPTARINLAEQRRQAVAGDVPMVAASKSTQRPGRRGSGTAGSGLQPLGLPSTLPTIDGTGDDEPNPSGGPDQVAANSDTVARDTMIVPRRSTGGTALDALPVPTAAADLLDPTLPAGSAGIEPRRRGDGGIAPSDDQPLISMPDIVASPRARREIGGPATPVGTRIAAVESFQRRVLRTEGGSLPSPSGAVGPETERAIELGLQYLANTQNEDGGWSLQGHGNEVALRSNTAATGLSLLAFQGAGYTHRQHRYADKVSRGLQYLIDNQKTSGDLYQSENQISDRNVALYSHGIASLALCEAYGMTQDPDLKEPAQGCLNYIINTQHQRRGGWRYTPQVSADTSVSGWMMMALKSGELAGLDVPSSTYDGIDRWLRLAQSPQRPDRYRYNPFAPDTPEQRHGRLATPTMTAVGMLMRMYSGWRRDRVAMQSAADYLLEFPPQIGTPQSPQRDTYYWYYATQVMFHMGGDHWRKWNEQLTPVLLENQIETGPMAGSWDPINPVPDRWSVHAGRLYVTTMNLLNLEVYYRHLPIYEEVHRKDPSAADPSAADPSAARR